MANDEVIPDASLQKRALDAFIRTILSNHRLWDTADLQAMTDLLKAALPKVPREPLDLQPIYAYLVEQGTPLDAVQETLLLFKSREARLAIRIALPNELEQIPK